MAENRRRAQFAGMRLTLRQDAATMYAAYCGQLMLPAANGASTAKTYDLS